MSIDHSAGLFWNGLPGWCLTLLHYKAGTQLHIHQQPSLLSAQPFLKGDVPMPGKRQCPCLRSCTPLCPHLVLFLILPNSMKSFLKISLLVSNSRKTQVAEALMCPTPLIGDAISREALSWCHWRSTQRCPGKSLIIPRASSQGQCCLLPNPFSSHKSTYRIYSASVFLLWHKSAHRFIWPDTICFTSRSGLRPCF